MFEIVWSVFYTSLSVRIHILFCVWVVIFHTYDTVNFSLFFVGSSSRNVSTWMPRLLVCSHYVLRVNVILGSIFFSSHFGLEWVWVWVRCLLRSKPSISSRLLLIRRLVCVLCRLFVRPPTFPYPLTSFHTTRTCTHSHKYFFFFSHDRKIRFSFSSFDALSLSLSLAQWEQVCWVVLYSLPVVSSFAILFRFSLSNQRKNESERDTEFMLCVLHFLWVLL